MDHVLGLTAFSAIWVTMMLLNIMARHPSWESTYKVVVIGNRIFYLNKAVKWMMPVLLPLGLAIILLLIEKF